MSPVRTKSKGCTTKVSKEIHRANVSPSNLDLKSHTNRNDGVSAGKPPKGTVSKCCAEEKSEEINKAKGLPSKYSSESCTRKDCSSVAEVKCSLKESNAKARKPEIVKAKIISKRPAAKL